MPTISVIIPAYNRAGVLMDAVRSVLAQTFRDLELIIVDDGSTDSTRQVVESLTDPRVRYVYRPNGGPAAARNTGLDAVKGDYIAFLDSDDYWPADFLKTMMAALSKKKGYGLAYCSIKLVDAQGRTVRIRTPEAVCRSGWVTWHLFRRGFVSPVAVLIRRERLKGIRFEEQLKTAEDSDFFLRLSLLTPFLYVRGIEVDTRLSENSQCLVTGPNCNRLLSLERFYRHCLENGMRPPWAARKKLSRQYYKVARREAKQNHRGAAACLYRQAVRYWPLDVRFYIRWAMTLFGGRERGPRWEMPPGLREIEW